MHIKKIAVITTVFLIYSNIVFSSQQQDQSLWQWLASWVRSSEQPNLSLQKKAFDKAVTANSNSLDLTELYRAKEKKSLIDPIQSAAKFKNALKNAANMPGLMHRFKEDHTQFFFGASSSSYQYEGGLDSTNANAIFYQKKGLEPAGIAIDFWNRYATDIPQMKKELGINSFRISIAWDRVQPAPQLWDTPDKTLWNESAIAKYVEIIKLLKQNGIEPIVVLHHYTIPEWFAEIGGFEKKENIIYFVEFAKKMYAALHQEVTYWSTFNAIEGYSFKGYWTQDGPPGLHNMQLTQTVLAHMLEAHVQIYQAIKGPRGMYSMSDTKDIPAPQIGLQKNIVPLDPSQRSNICVKTISGPFCVMGTTMQNKGFFDFFRTGVFKMRIPGWINVVNINHKAPKSLDWIGVNIYSKMEMRFAKSVPENRPEFKTENINYSEYPEGIYRAVKTIYNALALPLNIPIIITENGIATKDDTAGNAQRTRFFRRVLYTIRKLIEQGYPIIGYTPWASHDNYEWPSKVQPDPYDRQYGMFKVDTDKNSPHYLMRTLKEGAQYYRDFIQHYFKQEKK